MAAEAAGSIPRSIFIDTSYVLDCWLDPGTCKPPALDVLVFTTMGGLKLGLGVTKDDTSHACGKIRVRFIMYFMAAGTCTCSEGKIEDVNSSTNI
jgi:hypothetical protein